MDGLVGLLIAWLILSLSFFIISKLPTGVEIDDFRTAVVAAAVFGILNAYIGKALQILALPITWLTLGAFAIVVNAIVFGIAAALVKGFRLRLGFWTALIGAVSLSIVNYLLTMLVGKFF